MLPQQANQMGLTPVQSGRITFVGNEIQTLPSYAIARLGIGLVPEARQIFPNLTVTENIMATAGNRLGIRNPYTLDKVLELFPRPPICFAVNYHNRT